ncbi:hypothetical protein KQ51_01711 [Candidatus Izimaplasma bacterium HR1]|uniref:hypothetical protein n=1 Tax=Candidatus Izimoplasma sp. HR1 TaxID=1541959 RepID=UPI0004F7EDF2|nr:hypothetical protein KQ51_01711 [Candidatus Izimaplasma bacterium HR1]
MYKGIKITILIIMFICSILIGFEKDYEFITHEMYYDGYEEVFNDFVIEVETREKAIQKYKDKHIIIDGEYYREYYNWKEGMFFFSGTLLVTLVVSSSLRKEVEKKEIDYKF